MAKMMVSPSFNEIDAALNGMRCFCSPDGGFTCTRCWAMEHSKALRRTMAMIVAAYDDGDLAPVASGAAEAIEMMMDDARGSLAN